MSPSGQVVIGLAGHIDHGKTALVQALTGIDTDTQAEEKRRGMTIDIGFAFLTDSITLVDVPGHDRFVKNMVCGVAGIHMGLLVVAADDGIMNQTREHFHILRFLGVSRLCVAVNKLDLVEKDWLGLVEDDIRRLLAKTPYQDSPIVKVSAVTKDGVEELREVLIQEAARVIPWEDRGFFRLPIDRVFSLKGFGTVVTGTVVSGILHQGDSLELLPDREEVKLRSIQSHGRNVSAVALGDRAALNIANLSTEELARGEQLALPGYVTTSRLLAVHITLLEGSPALPHNHPVRVNIGTAEVIARLRLPDTGRLQPGHQGTAILELQETVPVVVGDRFILRSFSPVTTIGGGIITDVELPKRWREQKRWVNQLSAVSEAERLRLLISSRGTRPFTLKTLACRSGFSEHKLHARLTEDILQVGRDSNPWLLTPDQANTIIEQILAVVRSYHRSHPYQKGANREYIRQKIEGDQRFLDVWLKDMVGQDLLTVQDETWALPDFSIHLSEADDVLLNRLVETVRAQGFETEYLDALATRLAVPLEQLRTVCTFAEARGELVRLTDRMVLHKLTMQRFHEAVAQHFVNHKELTIADVKAMTGTTRKYTMPLMEYLDRNGHTVRIGDKRVRPDD